MKAVIKLKPAQAPVHIPSSSPQRGNCWRTSCASPSIPYQLLFTENGQQVCSEGQLLAEQGLENTFNQLYLALIDYLFAQRLVSAKSRSNLQKNIEKTGTPFILMRIHSVFPGWNGTAHAWAVQDTKGNGKIVSDHIWFDQKKSGLSTENLVSAGVTWHRVCFLKYVAYKITRFSEKKLFVIPR